MSTEHNSGASARCYDDAAPSRTLKVAASGVNGSLRENGTQDCAHLKGRKQMPGAALSAASPWEPGSGARAVLQESLGLKRIGIAVVRRIVL